MIRSSFKHLGLGICLWNCSGESAFRARKYGSAAPSSSKKARPEREPGFFVYDCNPGLCPTIAVPARLSAARMTIQR